MNKWVPGALAVIVVSEHPGTNLRRIVTLIEREYYDNKIVWLVKDGRPFTGYHPDTSRDTPLDRRVPFVSDGLVIAQWKLRLLLDDDETEENEGIRYIKGTA